MGKSQRVKGHSYERKIVRWLKRMLFEANRNVTETQTGNTGDVFVKLRWAKPNPVTFGPFRLVIQAKHWKSPSVWKAMAEAEEAAGRYPSEVEQGTIAIPVAIVRRTSDRTLVVMSPETFAGILAASETAWYDYSPEDVEAEFLAGHIPDLTP
jgi:hypothetical protein